MTLPVTLPNPLEELLNEINEDLAAGVEPKSAGRKKRYFSKKKTT